VNTVNWQSVYLKGIHSGAHVDREVMQSSRRDGRHMRIEIQAIPSCDDVFVVWRAHAPIRDCTGFALYRKHLVAPKKGLIDIVQNRISSSLAQPYVTESSETSPIRRFSWTDHRIYSGDQVQYAVKPVVHRNNENPFVDENSASPWSNVVTLSPACGDSFSCYFNRGLIMSQFMSRYMLRREIDPADSARVKRMISDSTERSIRRYLGGEMLKKILGMLDEALQSKQHIFLALFELSDEDLISRIEKLGMRAHILLANGPYVSGKPDANSDSRRRLKRANVDVKDRMLRPSQGLGHNKFLVVCDSQKRPMMVWTGSANWSPTALCTQINNSILIESPEVARVFLDQWHLLSEAGSGYPDSLVKSNSSAKQSKIGRVRVDSWFARTQELRDLAAVSKLIENAERGVLFLMFSPGKSPLLDVITKRASEKGLYVHGVISTMARGSTDRSQVTLIHQSDRRVVPLKIVQPQGIRHNLSHWAAEVTRKEFLQGIGWAIVHSKVIVIDPFDLRAAVVTGSHNFSKSASTKNDENMVIITGNSQLASAYAVNVKSVYDHFRWRAFVARAEDERKDPTSFLRDDKEWQYEWFRSGEKQTELSFWFNR
jgi:phosphatidylserine/phosphatidylglycerophosphate/cardiolipin synthase-like enzyme